MTTLGSLRSAARFTTAEIIERARLAEEAVNALRTSDHHQICERAQDESAGANTGFQCADLIGAHGSDVLTALRG